MTPLRRADRAVLSLCALLALTGLLARPIALAVDPELAVAAAFWGPVDPARVVFRGSGSGGASVSPGRPLDPWGTPWCDAEQLAPAARGGPPVYSAGPDGRDELGAGDDVVLSARGARAHSFLARAWGLGLAAAVVILATWSAARRAPRGQGRFATAADAVLLGVFALVASLVLTGLASDALALGAHAAPLLHVDGRLAFLGTCALTIVAVAIAGGAVTRSAVEDARDARPVSAPSPPADAGPGDPAPPSHVIAPPGGPPAPATLESSGRSRPEAARDGV